MNITQKNKRETRGRPQSTASAKRAAETRRRSDGQRLNAALQSLKLSQAEAARLSGIRQQWLNGVVNGSRAIGREDLRALASTLNISADYLLGVPGAPMFVGETFNTGLEEALAARVAREAITESAVPESWLRDAIVPELDAKKMLDDLVRQVKKEAKLRAEWATPNLEARLELRRIYGAIDPEKVLADFHGETDPEKQLSPLYRALGRFPLEETKFIHSSVAFWAALADRENAMLAAQERRQSSKPTKAINTPKPRTSK